MSSFALDVAVTLAASGTRVSTAVLPEVSTETIAATLATSSVSGVNYTMVSALTATASSSTYASVTAIAAAAATSSSSSSMSINMTQASFFAVESTFALNCLTNVQAGDYEAFAAIIQETLVTRKSYRKIIVRSHRMQSTISHKLVLHWNFTRPKDG